MKRIIWVIFLILLCKSMYAHAIEKEILQEEISLFYQQKPLSDQLINALLTKKRNDDRTIEQFINYTQKGDLNHDGISEKVYYYIVRSDSSGLIIVQDGATKRAIFHLFVNTTEFTIKNVEGENRLFILLHDSDRYGNYFGIFGFSMAGDGTMYPNSIIKIEYQESAMDINKILSNPKEFYSKINLAKNKFREIAEAAKRNDEKALSYLIDWKDFSKRCHNSKKAFLYYKDKYLEFLKKVDSNYVDLNTTINLKTSKVTLGTTDEFYSTYDKIIYVNPCIQDWRPEYWK